MYKLIFLVGDEKQSIEFEHPVQDTFLDQFLELEYLDQPILQIDGTDVNLWDPEYNLIVEYIILGLRPGKRILRLKNKCELTNLSNTLVEELHLMSMYVTHSILSIIENDNFTGLFLDDVHFTKPLFNLFCQKLDDFPRLKKVGIGKIVFDEVPALFPE